MATQRFTVAKVGGDAGRAVGERLRAWAALGDAERDAAVTAFALGLRANAHVPPVVSFCEWADLWLMGDTLRSLVEGSGGVYLVADRFSLGVCDDLDAVRRLPRDGWQYDEQAAFAARLREAADEWKLVVPDGVIVVVREVLGPSADDDEVRVSLAGVPGWLRGA